MAAQPSKRETPRETGEQIHRREVRRQIYAPFALGILLVVGAFLIVALPNQAIWRIRAEAIADWTYTILCLFPLVICSMPLFVIVLIGIWGMGRIHTSTERPLKRLEIYSGKLADQIDKGVDYVNQKTVQFSSAIAPLDRLFGIWERSANTSGDDET